MSVISSGINGLRISQKQRFVGAVDITVDLNVDLSRFEAQKQKAQRYLDQAVLDDSNKFAPELNAVLKKSGTNNTTIGSGVVQWGTPYGHYVYKGLAMAGPKYGPKHYTGKQLNIQKSVNPFASKEWFEVAKTRNKVTWVRNVKHIAGGG